MTLRTPYDGSPYYCAVCGAGFYEFMSCERTDCEREDVREAERRRDKIRGFHTLPDGTKVAIVHPDMAKDLKG